MTKLPLFALVLGLGVGLSVDLATPGAASAAAVACDDESGLCVDSGGASFVDGKQSTGKDRKKRSKKTAGTLSVTVDGGRGSVFVNGRFVGEAPVDGVDIPSGKNDIHVRDGATVLANGLLTIPKDAVVSVTVRHD
ncbi:MAG: hypothetical protein AAGF11_05050 [Myxococcota bacterium]